VASGMAHSCLPCDLLKKPNCYRKLRENVIFSQARMSPVADLGFGVLDAAMADTMEFVLETGSFLRGSPSVLEALEGRTQGSTRAGANSTILRQPDFAYLPSTSNAELPPMLPT